MPRQRGFGAARHEQLAPGAGDAGVDELTREHADGAGGNRSQTASNSEPWALRTVVAKSESCAGSRPGRRMLPGTPPPPALAVGSRRGFDLFPDFPT